MRDGPAGRSPWTAGREVISGPCCPRGPRGPGSPPVLPAGTAPRAPAPPQPPPRGPGFSASCLGQLGPPGPGAVSPAHAVARSGAPASPEASSGLSPRVPSWRCRSCFARFSRLRGFVLLCSWTTCHLHSLSQNQAVRALCPRDSRSVQCACPGAPSRAGQVVVMGPQRAHWGWSPNTLESGIPIKRFPAKVLNKFAWRCFLLLMQEGLPRPPPPPPVLNGMLKQIQGLFLQPPLQVICLQWLLLRTLGREKSDCLQLKGWSVSAHTSHWYPLFRAIWEVAGQSPVPWPWARCQVSRRVLY